jgi:uncharacterized membrane protein
MSNLKSFVSTCLLGGILVLLPIAIFAFIVQWLFEAITSIIEPLTRVVAEQFGLPPNILSHLVVIAILLAACFMVGLFVRTRLGSLLYTLVEESVLKRAPGYSLIKETVVHFIGKKESPFASVALAQIFGNDTLVSAFVTDRHEDGTVTVFVPTGPNPTSGNIYHLQARFVHPVDVPVEEAMRAIISCGAGSGPLIQAYNDAASTANGTPAQDTS